MSSRTPRVLFYLAATIDEAREACFEAIHAAAGEMVDRSFSDAFMLVASNWPAVQAVVRALLKRERLTGDAVEELIEAASARPQAGS